MMFLKRFLLVVVTLLLLIFILIYPRLNIISGYAAKNAASSVFLANRSIAFTNANDNNFSPINLAKTTINKKKKSTTSSAFNLLTRTAV